MTNAAKRMAATGHRPVAIAKRMERRLAKKTINKVLIKATIVNPFDHLDGISMHFSHNKITELFHQLWIFLVNGLEYVKGRYVVYLDPGQGVDELVQCFVA